MVVAVAPFWLLSRTVDYPIECVSRRPILEDAVTLTAPITSRYTALPLRPRADGERTTLPESQHLRSE